MGVFLNTINVSWIIPGISTIFLFIDAIVYAILQGAIEIFFMIGSLDFSSVTSDLQVVIHNINTLIGIYILFKASLLLIQYLIDPDKFKDKSQGGEALLKSVVIVVVLLVLLKSNVLFGIFNDAQRIVFGSGGEFEVLNAFGLEPSPTDMIQKIVFGSENIAENKTSIAHTIAVRVFENFLYIYEDDDTKKPIEGGWYNYSPATYNVFDAKSMMGYVAQGKIQAGISFFALKSVGNIFSSFSKIQYTAILSTVFGVYMILVFFKYGSQLVIRFLKLILLQMLSPIAIVSYVTPDGKSTFKNFWKTYFSIYMELFIRLLVVYISIYLMSVVLNNKLLGNPGDAIGSLIFKIILLCAINKFMQEMPNIIASIFGGKLDDKQKSMGAILGGVLGGGIGLATGIGSARAAGATGWGSAFGGAMGMFGGAKSGSSSQNVGAFVSGQISNASKASGRGFDIADAGGMGSYIQMHADRNFGGANRLKTEAGNLKMQADNHSKSNGLFSNITDENTKSYLKKEIGQGATEADYFSSKMGATEAMVAESIRQGEAYIVNSADGGQEVVHSMEDFYSTRSEWNKKLKSDADKDLGEQIKNNNFREDGLRQAYANFNTHEEIASKQEHRAARTINVATDTSGVVTNTNLKELSDNNKAETAQRQRKYDNYVSQQRYKNIGGK